MKRLFTIMAAALMAVTALFSLVACGGSSDVGAKDYDDVKAAGKIVVGMECAYAPYNWSQTSANEYTVKIADGMYADGYDVQIAKKIAEDLGVTLEIKPLEWDGLIPALNAKSIDLVIAGMSPTDDRRLSIDFSDTYLDSNLVMVVRKDGKYANATQISDFSGARITGQLNTFHYDVIDQIQGVNKQNALENFAALTTALRSGTIDGYVCERPGGKGAAAADSNFTYIEFGEGKGFTYDPAEASIAVGLRKGSSLTEKVNATIAKLSTDDKEALMAAAISRQPVSQES